MDISFKLDPETIIGPDTVSRIGSICARYGNRVMIAAEPALYEKQSIERLVGILGDSGIEAIVFDEIPGQATAEVAESAATLARGARCSAVIGFGSLAIQSIARIAAMITPSRMPVFDLLDGRKSEGDFLPFIAIPTSGRDPFMFTDYFIAIDPRDRSVRQIKSPVKMCAAAIVDSSLAESFSGAFSATAAFDGFCLAAEAYCSTRANFLSDALLEQAMSLYAKIMDAEGISAGLDIDANSTGAGFLVSLGSAASAPGIGAALAYAISGRYPVAKSWTSTVILPYIMERLVAARPEKIAKVAALLGETTENVPVADAASLAVENIRRRMGILKVPARLKEFNLSLDRLVTVADCARALEFVAFTPWTVSADDTFDILKQAF